MRSEATKKLFTVDEYYRMVEAGILKEGRGTELIAGEIIEMSAMGPRHCAAVNRADESLTLTFKGRALVRVQLPVRLNQFSEPEPDITLVRLRQDFYERRHPLPADVLLVFEISDTSLPYDINVKLPTYAAVRIPEVWIEDLARETLSVFRHPARGAYTTLLELHRGDSVSLLAYPEIAFPVESLLGPGQSS
jgi:Uma2 family endonuclease